jgi:lipopolysaccharide/colanic/teichoic acid biosynthesis glycosyltransferase
MLIIRRLIDIFLSLLLIIIFSPIFLLIGSLIKINSPGPIFFKQKRIGCHGKIFIIWKFRTMLDNSHQSITVSKSDEGITLTGKILRPTHLDELPQLWNVLKGEMSFVGPRPKTQNILEILKKFNSDYEEILKVKPGITGINQIKSRGWIFSNLEKSLELELQYVQNKNFWQDLKIVILTLPVILKRRGI